MKADGVCKTGPAIAHESADPPLRQSLNSASRSATPMLGLVTNQALSSLTTVQPPQASGFRGLRREAPASRPARLPSGSASPAHGPADSPLLRAGVAPSAISGGA